ncbi:YigZ family protein [Methylomonas sp. LL1]|uniref:YigZ family protein n=1 Tax=Methylomonas sp. LL1 TaxID=2785785 RepID=UPI0018C35640|nr:YigZ family protein [Methylomonas sp. LL1]QPK62107.1 YigZ family protein [Methylomonas sp. LL1]
MKIVVKTREYEETIKKSRFIGIISPCASEREALLLLKKLHDQHPNANHIVHAYRIQSPDGLIRRFHDAGEPSGTAGKPVFQHLEGKQLINLVVAVIRYFGGIKLGAGGLTRAYGNIAKQVIECAEIIDYIEMADVRLTLDYSQLQMLDYQLKKLDGEVLQQDFAEQVHTVIKIPKQNLEALRLIFQ